MEKHFFQIQGQAEGTSYNIIYEALSPSNMQVRVNQLLANFENSLSIFNSSSIISRINRGEKVRIDNHFKVVFNKAKEISKQTEGLFDISAEPLFRAWADSLKKGFSLDSSQIYELLCLTGIDIIQLCGDYIRSANCSIQLNMNAIAKGYSVDLVAQLLDSEKMDNYLVEIGGELRAKGVSPRGLAWAVGIDRPADTNRIPGQDVQVVLHLSNKALATSGNYRQFYIHDGKKYSHTINPKTGYPVDHNLLSVTVIAHDAMSADAYATAFLVAGVDKTLDLLENIDEVEVLFICDESGEFKVHYTEGLEKYLLL